MNIYIHLEKSGSNIKKQT